METDSIIHQIRDFLGAIERVPLGCVASDKVLCPRAGVIIYHRDKDDLYFYLFLPKQKPDKLTPPDFQIAKGGRTVILKNGEAFDVRTVEDLIKGVTLDATLDALREGMEEQGLRLTNINALYEIGKVEFISQTKGIAEPMWCYAVEILSKDAFDKPSDPKTERCAWFSMKTLENALEADKNVSSVQLQQNSVRTDHIKILIDFAERLVRHEIR